jgi:hypothetical protein
MHLELFKFKFQVISAALNWLNHSCRILNSYLKEDAVSLENVLDKKFTIFLVLMCMLNLGRDQA